MSEQKFYYKEFSFPSFPVREDWNTRVTSPQSPRKEVQSSSSARPNSAVAVRKPSTAEPRQQQQQEPSPRPVSQLAKKQNASSDQISQLKKQVNDLDRDHRNLQDKYLKKKPAQSGRGSPVHEEDDFFAPPTTSSRRGNKADDLPLSDAFSLLKSKYVAMQKKFIAERHDLQQEYDQLHHEYQKQLDTGKVLDERIRLLREELSSTQHSRVQWKSEKQQNFFELKKDYDLLKSNFDALQSRYGNLAKESQNVADQLNKQIHANQAVKQELQNSQNLSAEVQGQLHDVLKGKKIEEIQLASRGYEQQLSLLQKQLDNLHNAYTTLETNHRSLESDFSTLEGILAKTKADLEAERNRVGEWSQKFRAAELENERVKAELKTVSGQVKSYEEKTASDRQRVIEFLKTIPTDIQFSGGRNNTRASKQTLESNAELTKGKQSLQTINEQGINDNFKQSFGSINIPTDLKEILERDPLLKVLSISAIEKNNKIAKLEADLKRVSSSDEASIRKLHDSNELNHKHALTIDSLKKTVDKLEHEQAGLQENLSTVTSAYSKLEQIKNQNEQELGQLKLDQAQWVRDRIEIQRLKDRLAEMEKTLKKVEEWKKVVGENERVSKEVVGLMNAMTRDSQENLAAVTDLQQNQNSSLPDSLNFSTGEMLEGVQQ